MSVLAEESTGVPLPGVVDGLRLLSAQNTVFCVSHRSQPAWFSSALPTVKYQHIPNGRQSGRIVSDLIKANHSLELQLSDFVVVTGSDPDMIMAANAKAMVLRAEWARGDGRWRKYGIPVRTPDELAKLVALLNTSAPWYFKSADDEAMRVFALANGGSWNQPPECDRIAGQLRTYLKHGSEVLRGLQLHLLSSIYLTPEVLTGEVWGFYPSSTPKVDADELMADIARLIREPCNKRYAEPGQPLFQRHRQASQRHAGGLDRTNPDEQLTSVCLNPEAKRRVAGKHVVVLDDYLTYGLSFSVGSALLRAAGAQKVTSIAVGKFGDAALEFDIEVTGDPCRPLTRADYVFRGSRRVIGQYATQAQLELLEKFGRTLL